MPFMLSLLSFASTFALAIAAGPSFCAKHAALTSCLKSNAEATAFCQSYLSKTTSTVTVTRTRRPVTTSTVTEEAYTYLPVYTTRSASVGTQTVEAHNTGTLQTTCSRTTLSPYTTTQTIPFGPTIEYTFTGPNVKRDLASPTDTCTPSCVSGRPSATISAACSCLSVQNPTTTVTSVTRAPTSKVERTVTSGTHTYYYPTTTTAYGSTVVITSTSYAATKTTYEIQPDSTYAVNSTTYNVFDKYRFQFDYTGISFYSCEYGLADLQPQPPKVTDCTNGVTDCLQVCPYVKGCTAVLYESRDINSNRTCAFINTRTNPLSCGYVDDLDQFGVQEGFGPS